MSRVILVGIKWVYGIPIFKSNKYAASNWFKIKNRYFLIWKVKKLPLNSAKRKKFEVVTIYCGRQRQAKNSGYVPKPEISIKYRIHILIKISTSFFLSLFDSIILAISWNKEYSLLKSILFTAYLLPLKNGYALYPFHTP